MYSATISTTGRTDLGSNHYYYRPNYYALLLCIMKRKYSVDDALSIMEIKPKNKRINAYGSLKENKSN